LSIIPVLELELQHLSDKILYEREWPVCFAAIKGTLNKQ